MEMVDLLIDLKEDVKTKLAQNDLDIPFVIKIVDDDRFVGVYVHQSVRSGTAKIQISSSIGEQFNKIRPNADLNYEIKVTISHELIHAIQDLVYYVKDLECDYDEDEAENLGIMLASGESIRSQPLIQNLISLMKEVK